MKIYNLILATLIFMIGVCMFVYIPYITGLFITKFTNSGQNIYNEKLWIIGVSCILLLSLLLGNFLYIIYQIYHSLNNKP